MLIQTPLTLYRVNPGNDAEAGDSSDAADDDDDDGDGKPGISLAELLAAGPNTSLKDRRGNTALHILVSPTCIKSCWTLTLTV